jgi:hypothetical protein
MELSFSQKLHNAGWVRRPERDTDRLQIWEDPEGVCYAGVETISSQAVEGKGPTEGVTTRFLSPNNNGTHERPAPVRQ